MNIKSISSMFFGEDTCFKVYGYSSCPYYQKAVKLGEVISDKNNNIKVETVQIDRDQWPELMNNLTQQHGGKAIYHKTCPIVEEGCSEEAKQFVGGYSDFLNESRKRKYKR
ncbi:hypothetical protein PPL_05696 [Heterostelium album PN500]|uniref:Glutaredoxin domain-containing protein n=1 Tax=Heterostelium pallidum (strain ATCC 26659 / Pp 5 / PN500) TaxID=670386 RepID=D3BAW5_HETP5|nr:hypothetical protein PPL_05696 [Heterostelium album PN500]EFA81702.1 hypothetical protein PPL_05696 [Heterostelium album PN500]|eukprot:XP_020433819.1 hypothetical protein PPL_05696 [Heterostelium album PN500]